MGNNEEDYYTEQLFGDDVDYITVNTDCHIHTI
jgi:hypothetical protein